MLEEEEYKKLNEQLEDSRDINEKNQPFLQKTRISSNLNDIKPRANQVWNWDEIRFYPNGIGNKVICTYKFFQGEKCGRLKPESKQHSGARYLYLPDPMGNTSCHPSLFNNTRNNPNISTSKSH